MQIPPEGEITGGGEEDVMEKMKEQKKDKVSHVFHVFVTENIFDVKANFFTHKLSNIWTVDSHHHRKKNKTWNSKHFHGI